MKHAAKCARECITRKHGGRRGREGVLWSWNGGATLTKDAAHKPRSRLQATLSPHLPTLALGRWRESFVSFSNAQRHCRVLHEYCSSTTRGPCLPASLLLGFFYGELEKASQQSRSACSTGTSTSIYMSTCPPSDVQKVQAVLWNAAGLSPFQMVACFGLLEAGRSGQGHKQTFIYLLWKGGK